MANTHIPKRANFHSLAAILGALSLTGGALLSVASAAHAEPAAHLATPYHASSTAAAFSGADRLKMQKALDAIVDAGAPGVIAEVRDTHHGVWTGGSGRADLTTDQPLIPAGKFRAGSITKSFTATVVLQLVAEKEIALDAPIERYLPGVVPNGKNISVRDLLDHRSGLFNYTDTLWPGGFPEIYQTRFQTWTPQHLLANAFQHTPYFAPGSSGHYSNTNYVLLGLLIEKVTGKPAEREIGDRILRPLGMHNSSLAGRSVRIPGTHAHGYVHLNSPDGAYTDVTDDNMSWAWTAGELISTTEDLNKFYMALLGGRLMPSNLLRQMKVMHTLDDDNKTQYGLGLSRIDNPVYGSVYGHIGTALGYNTYSFTTADNSRQVTISVSTMPDTQKISAAENRALTELLSTARKS
ncbi:serine hydrolase domain-containing protein [Streptomyces sp. NPDC051917]|uniref:serine hydrolase domain-containing protein n=1 Tax=Streptomyces sp. NPDC051917 TaxID=3154754 RepID=UPI003456D954